TMNEQGRSRQQSPADGDARDPATRADAREDDVAGHLEERVAEKENARAESIRGRAEAKILVHLQRREAHVHAVDEAHDVQREQEGQQSAAYLARGRLLHVVHVAGGSRGDASAARTARLPESKRSTSPPNSCAAAMSCVTLSVAPASARRRSRSSRSVSSAVTTSRKRRSAAARAVPRSASSLSWIAAVPARADAGTRFASATD